MGSVSSVIMQFYTRALMKWSTLDTQLSLILWTFANVTTLALERKNEKIAYLLKRLQGTNVSVHEQSFFSLYFKVNEAFICCMYCGCTAQHAGVFTLSAA